jgi:6-pyruvoyl tetrahydropterin synthase/QueD family protein
MWTISRDYHFAAAHRLEGHPKCGRMHGHNYEMTAILTVGELQDGWVMDYAQLDAVVKPVIEELDHRYIVSKENLAMEDPYYVIAKERGDDVFLPVERSTVESMCVWLHDQIVGALGLLGMPNVEVAVRLKESSRSTATYM